MPTYVYRREDGTTFEIEQRITEDALAICPTTGQSVTRVITGGTGLIFKGSGFYLTDYARGNGSPAAKSESSEKTNTAPEKSTSSSKDSTSATTKKKSDD